MVIYIPDIGDLNFEYDNLPIDGDYYTSNVKECVDSNFTVRRVNGHTIYLCSCENGSGIDYYFSRFIINEDFLDDVHSFYSNDFEFYTWAIMEMRDPELSCAPWLEEIIQLFDKDKKAFLYNQDNQYVYVLVDFDKWEDGSIPQKYLDSIEEICKTDLIESLNYEDGDDPDDFYSMCSEWCSDWGMNVVKNYLGKFK